MRPVLEFFTTNPGKWTEVRERLSPLGWTVLQNRRPLMEPQADGLQEVARWKLGQLPRSGRWTLVEDSGLFVHGLRGFPGVYSAYALRTLGVTRLARITPRDDRKATFRAVMGLRRPTGESHFFQGVAEGTLALRPRGVEGFGFDPIFIPQGERRTFAQMAPSEKNLRSHRGHALEKLVDQLGRLRPKA